LQEYEQRSSILDENKIDVIDGFENLPGKKIDVTDKK
jgi:hypothetical protein